MPGITLQKIQYPLEFISIGDTIKYTIVATNSDTIPISNTVLFDTIPNGTSFVTNSLTINGVVTSANPQTGAFIGTINPLSSATVAFNVVVTTAPNIDAIVNCASLYYYYSTISNGILVNSNCVRLPLQPSCLSVVKSLDKDNIVMGETLTYTVTVKNSCSGIIYNAVFYDTISSCLTFVQNSVSVDGVILPGGNPVSGISLGQIAPGQTRTIQFKVIAVSCPCSAQNIAQVVGRVISSIGTIIPITGYSNTVTTNIRCEIPLKINKETCKCTPCLKENIPYTIKVTNISSATVRNIVVTDTASTGVFVSSTTISAGSISESNNVVKWTIPSLAPGATETAMIIMIATDRVCFDNKGYIVNRARVVSYNDKDSLYDISDSAINHVECFCCNCKE